MKTEDVITSGLLIALGFCLGGLLGNYGCRVDSLPANALHQWYLQQQRRQGYLLESATTATVGACQVIELLAFLCLVCWGGAVLALCADYLKGKLHADK